MAGMSADWEVTEGKEISPVDRDSRVFEWSARRGDKRWKVYVYISGTLMAIDPGTLAATERAIVMTMGRSAVEESLARGRTSRGIKVTTAGIWEEEATAEEITAR